MPAESEEAQTPTPTPARPSSKRPASPAAAVHGTPNPAPPPEKKVRVRTGCLTCRRRRRKCDETKPRCGNCVDRDQHCEWGVKATFRETNAISLAPEHIVALQQSPPSSYTFVDLTSDMLRHYNKYEEGRSPSGTQSNRSTGPEESPQTVHGNDEDSESGSNRELGSSRPRRSAVDADVTSHRPSPVQFSPLSTETPRTGDLRDQPSPLHGIATEMPLGPAPAQTYPFSTPPEMHHSPPIQAPQAMSPLSNLDSRASVSFAAMELMALSQCMYPDGHPHHMTAASTSSPHGVSPNSQLSPENTITTSSSVHHHHDTVTSSSAFELEDHRDLHHDPSGMDLVVPPGSSYEELQDTLRHHILLSAKSNVPTRQSSPTARGPEAGFGPAAGGAVEGVVERWDLSSGKVSPDLTPEREAVLLKNYLDEVGPWLDMFDNARHFQHKIPILAKSAPHLKYSVLALSARQLHSVDPGQPSSESLALYQKAIYYLLPRLSHENKSMDVIASCVILCVLEMMSCSPDDWRRHLEGCAALFDAIQLHGHVGGMGQSLFWCFARMDVCGGIIAEENTIVPITKWSRYDLSLDEVSRLFLLADDFDMWANYAVYLCGHVLNLLASKDTPSAPSVLSSSSPSSSSTAAAAAAPTAAEAASSPKPNCSSSRESYRERWRKLAQLLQEWYDKRPEEMRPLLTLPAPPEDDRKPFPTVVYGNAPAISGNQMYHTSSVLLGQAKPKGEKLGKNSKSILWHARQICGISVSNTHHGCWNNALQPLWVAGRIMSHPSEHRAILETIHRIERSTGWKMSWRAEDLKEFWGEGEDEGGE